MSRRHTFPEKYTELLDKKVNAFQKQFEEANLACPNLSVFESPREHYRMRAEFKVWQEGRVASYAMHEKGQKNKPYLVDSFPVACESIESLMAPLMVAINDDDMLRERLFQIEFLSTKRGDTLVTLIYHKVLGKDWDEKARALAAQFSIGIIGRSRKQKVVLDREWVEEQLTVANRTYIYQQVEGSFTQPNAYVCELMLTWALAQSEGLSGDLLELYCGNGNFTIPLSTRFDKVLATEISKTSVKSAQYNFESNEVDNITIARMSSEEFTEAFDGVRKFNRLRDIDLGEYEFSTVFVDPPRAGLDAGTVELVRRFDNIIYISCNPSTLVDNLSALSSTHEIINTAVFDQFPYTDHLEAGVMLKRREQSQ